MGEAELSEICNVKIAFGWELDEVPTSRYWLAFAPSLAPAGEQIIEKRGLATPNCALYSKWNSGFESLWQDSKK